MKINEKFSLKGNVKKILRDEKGNVIDTMEDKNLVVDTGLAGIISLLSMGGENPITYIKIGAGGVGEDPESPIDPTKDQESLLDEKYSKALESYEIGDEGLSVTFNGLFLSTEVDSMVSEVGLGFSGGNLFARHTFPSSYLKADRGFSLEIYWTIKFEQV